MSVVQALTALLFFVPTNSPHAQHYHSLSKWLSRAYVPMLPSNTRSPLRLDIIMMYALNCPLTLFIRPPSEGRYSYAPQLSLFVDCSLELWIYVRTSCQCCQRLTPTMYLVWHEGTRARVLHAPQPPLLLIHQVAPSSLF